MPDLANVHIDTFLTNISIGYTNEMYLAETVWPVIPVPKRSDKYVIYNKDSFLRSSGTNPQGKPGSVRRPGTRSTAISFDISNNAFYAEQLAKHYPLTDAEVNYADSPLQPAVDATIALTETIKLDNEIAVSKKTMTRANYASGNKAQLVTNTTSWAAATGKPFSVDLQNAKKAVIKGIIRAATHMLLDYDAAVVLSQNAEYVERVKYTTKEALTEAGLLPVLAGLTVLEARSQYATSDEGITPVTTGYNWVDDQGEDSCLVFHRPATVTGLRTVQFGATFEAPDDTLGARGFVVKRWREEWKDAEMIEVRTTRDWRGTCTDGSTNGDGANGYFTGGYLISGCTL